MPIKQAAKKALRQAKKRTARNFGLSKKIEFITKQIKRAVEGKNAADAAKMFSDLQQALDKAAKNHVIHANKGARTVSRWKKKINALKK
ncbi:MAG: 30S ribosomal protein S20 [Patescibacteria group bacterium]